MCVVDVRVCLRSSVGILMKRWIWLQICARRFFTIFLFWRGELWFFKSLMSRSQSLGLHQYFLPCYNLFCVSDLSSLFSVEPLCFIASFNSFDFYSNFRTESWSDQYTVQKAVTMQMKQKEPNKRTKQHKQDKTNTTKTTKKPQQKTKTLQSDIGPITTVPKQG